MKEDRTGISTIFLSLSLFISKFFGFLREMLIAKYFGASAEVDAYLIATQIPYFLSILISSGTGSAFVPVYTQTRTENDSNKQEEFLNSVATFTFLLLISLVILTEIFSPSLIKLLTPGISEKCFKIAVSLSRVTIPYFFFVEIGTLFQLILQSYSFFSLIILWQLIPNLILAVIIIFFSTRYGIFSLSVGFLLTGILYFWLMGYGVYRLKIKIKVNFNFSNPEFKRFLKLAFPAVIGGSIYILSPFVDRFIASFFGEGSIAVLNFAYRIILLPISSLVLAFSFVIFPKLSKHFSNNDLKKLKETLFISLRIILYVLMPVFIFFLVLAVPIIRVVYERGNFTSLQTFLTGKVLQFFSISILGYGISEILTKTFYSRQDTQLPLKITIISTAINIILNLILSFFMGVCGIAFATGLTSILSAFLLFKYSGYEKEIFKEKDFLKAILKILFSGVLLGIFFYFSLSIINLPVFLLTLEKRVFILGIVLISGFFLYWMTTYILKSEEEKIIRENGIGKILEKFYS